MASCGITIKEAVNGTYLALWLIAILPVISLRGEAEMIPRTRMAVALALTLGMTPVIFNAAAPSRATAAVCTTFEGHQIDSPPSILAWDYVQCGANRTNLPVVIVDENTDKVVAQGTGEAFYLCHGTALTRYAAAGAVFEANCGGPS